MCAAERRDLRKARALLEASLARWTQSDRWGDQAPAFVRGAVALLTRNSVDDEEHAERCKLLRADAD